MQNIKPKLGYDVIDYSITNKDFHTWVDAIIQQLRQITPDSVRNNISQKVLVEYNWRTIASKWI